MFVFLLQNSRMSRKAPKSNKAGGKSLNSSREQTSFTPTGHFILQSGGVGTCITTSTSVYFTFSSLFSIRVPPCRLIPYVRGRDFLMELKVVVYLLMLYVGAAHRFLPHILLGSKVSLAHIFFAFFFFKGDRSRWCYHQHFLIYLLIKKRRQLIKEDMPVTASSKVKRTIRHQLLWYLLDNSLQSPTAIVTKTFPWKK